MVVAASLICHSLIAYGNQCARCIKQWLHSICVQRARLWRCRDGLALNTQAFRRLSKRGRMAAAGQYTCRPASMSLANLFFQRRDLAPGRRRGTPGQRESGRLSCRQWALGRRRPKTYAPLIAGSDLSNIAIVGGAPSMAGERGGGECTRRNTRASSARSSHSRIVPTSSSKYHGDPFTGLTIHPNHCDNVMVTR